MLVARSMKTTKDQEWEYLKASLLTCSNKIPGLLWLALPICLPNGFTFSFVRRLEG